MKAAIYARYSPGRDRDKTSTIETQLAMCREKAAADGVTIDEDHIYIDRGISGSTIERAAFQQILSNIEAGAFPETLYAKDDKRLFRNEREAGELVEWIWEHEVKIGYCLVAFGDPRSSDESWFSQRMYHLFAELEGRRKARETFEHQRQNALQGYVNEGLPPYGYRRKEVEITDDVGVRKKKLTWEIAPEESPAIKLAFELNQEGKGIKLIAEALTKLGYRSRRGAPMNKATVGEWFRNPYPFAGCTVWNTHDHKLKPKPRSVWIVVEGTHPAITDVEMAEDVYQRVEQRKTGKRRRVRMGEYLFTGLLKCSECEHNFVINSSIKRNQAYYVCGTRTRRRDGCQNKLHLDHQRLEGSICHSYSCIRK